MLEVELKFPVADFTALERLLSQRGAQSAAVREETDHYFNAPDRDFACTDEALRVRRIGDANFVTYKGPRRDPTTKTRTELEVRLADGTAAADDFGVLLTHLGYRPVAVVRKCRRVYRLPDVGFPTEACLDEVEGLGCFVELEIVTDEHHRDAARDHLLRLADELGLRSSERRSYLELLLAAR